MAVSWHVRHIYAGKFSIRHQYVWKKVILKCWYDLLGLDTATHTYKVTQRTAMLKRSKQPQSASITGIRAAGCAGVRWPKHLQYGDSQTYQHSSKDLWAQR